MNNNRYADIYSRWMTCILLCVLSLPSIANIAVTSYPKVANISHNAKGIPYQFQYQFSVTEQNPAAQQLSLYFQDPSSVWKAAKAEFSCDSDSLNAPINGRFKMPKQASNPYLLQLPEGDNARCEVRINTRIFSLKTPEARVTAQVQLPLDNDQRNISLVTQHYFADGSEMGADAQRKITLKNYCPYPVSVAFLGDVASTHQPQKNQQCRSDQDCIGGSYCAQTNDLQDKNIIRQCRWRAPITAPGAASGSDANTNSRFDLAAFRTTPAPAITTVVPVYNNATPSLSSGQMISAQTSEAVWQGHITAHPSQATGGLTAKIQLQLYKGAPIQNFTPGTEYENQLSDRYYLDVSQGVGVPMALLPAAISPEALPAAQTSPPSGANCPSLGFGSQAPLSCDWRGVASALAPLYRAIVADPQAQLAEGLNAQGDSSQAQERLSGADGCNCQAPNLCGIAAGEDQSLTRTCGTPIAGPQPQYWTPAALCRRYPEQAFCQPNSDSTDTVATLQTQLQQLCPALLAQEQEGCQQNVLHTFDGGIWRQSINRPHYELHLCPRQ